MGRELGRQLKRRVSDDHFDAVRRPTLRQEVATAMVLVRRTVVDQIGRDHQMAGVTKYPHDSARTAGWPPYRPRKWFGAQRRERGRLGRFVEFVTAGGIGMTDQHEGTPSSWSVDCRSEFASVSGAFRDAARMGHKAQFTSSQGRPWIWLPILLSVRIRMLSAKPGAHVDPSKEIVPPGFSFSGVRQLSGLGCAGFPACDAIPPQIQT